MAYWGDYHTHSTYSHGKGTIEDNVKTAISKGLKQLAITDHGYKHLTYNIPRKIFPAMMKETADLRIKYPEIDLFLGLETNFNSLDGNVDIKHSDMPNLDIVVCGYHKFVTPFHIDDFFCFFAPNFILDTLRLTKKSVTRRNTDAYLRALEKYDLDVIAHINYSINVDAVEVAKACKYYGTKLELNGKRINLSDKDMERVVETGVELICNSDAHSAQRVGDFSLQQKVIDRLGIPYSQICNWERFPEFRSVKKKREAKAKEVLDDGNAPKAQGAHAE